MSRKGQFRVKSIGELLPPNSIVPLASPDAVVKTEPDLKPPECLDISDDDFVTPIKKCSQNIKNGKRTTVKKASVSKQKNDTVSKTVVNNEPDRKPPDYLDLTDDDLITPIKKCPQNTAKRATTKKGPVCTQKNGTVPNTIVPLASLKPVIKNEADLKPPDCLELTDDDLVTPVKKCSQNNTKNTTTKKGPVSTLKSDTVTKTSRITSSTTKLKKISDAQTKLDSYFPTSSHVKMAPRKQKPLESTSGDGILSIETGVTQESKRKPLRRKLIPTAEEPINVKTLKMSNRNSSPVTIPETVDLCSDSDEELENKKCKPSELVRRPRTINSEKSICPSYKVIEGTTFAVDAFKFGRIEGVTVYFLTHFHADHYIGLTKKFSMPIYTSKITANLMREFIPVDEKFVNIFYLDRTFTIDGVQITPIDANHCPGAVMLLFQLPCGKRILHTGDFRASQEMEHNRHLMKKNIDILYLDTTYISNKYSFQSQTKSIFQAIQLIQEFKERNEGKRILYVCGAYLVGKEKCWSQIAKVFDFKVWTDDKRMKVMRAIDNEEILQRLVKTASDADMHVVSLMKIGYKGIQEYWQDYSDKFDMIFAIRPSGWEKNSKPQYRGEVNVIGVEYSEHSSHDEMRRFVGFLMPKEVISTVPLGKDQTKCPDVPLSWYRKEHFLPIKKQASISDYYKVIHKQ